MTPPVQEPSVMRQTTHRSFSSSDSDKYKTKSLPRHAATKSKVTEIHESAIPEGKKKSHYITEVYVHRSPGAVPTGMTLDLGPLTLDLIGCLQMRLIFIFISLSFSFLYFSCDKYIWCSIDSSYVHESQICHI